MDKAIETKWASYSDEVREKLLGLRALVFEVAKEEELGQVQESLKWGEASYTVEGGSPFRFDWKEKTPDFVFMYVICNSRLAETYRELYGSKLNVDGKRAIALPMSDALPVRILKDCISMAMKYHKIKHLPLLGR
ncbi:DUF1801 domain-containing protein [Curvivirga sp.]|uniref:DUF1801 domain-containing protein n=1 Tax=Curvivirga sp. TaxID=2856848 RepID=UPI003B5B15AA